LRAKGKSFLVSVLQERKRFFLKKEAKTFHPLAPPSPAVGPHNRAGYIWWMVPTRRTA
jgi:hypothetical protein